MDPITGATIIGAALQAAFGEGAKVVGKKIGESVVENVKTKGLWNTVKRAFVISGNTTESTKLLEEKHKLGLHDIQLIEGHVKNAIQKNSSFAQLVEDELSILDSDLFIANLTVKNILSLKIDLEELNEGKLKKENIKLKTILSKYYDL